MHCIEVLHDNVSYFVLSKILLHRRFNFILQVDQFSEEKLNKEIFSTNLTSDIHELPIDDKINTTTTTTTTTKRYRVLLKWEDFDTRFPSNVVETRTARQYYIFCDDSTGQCSVQNLGGEVYPIKPPPDSSHGYGFFLGCVTSARFQIDTLLVPDAVGAFNNVRGGRNLGFLKIKILTHSPEGCLVTYVEEMI